MSRVDGNDFLLGEPESMPIDGSDLQTAEEEDDPMAIDEEGRPRFAPVRDIVSMAIHSFLYLFFFFAKT